MSTNIKGSMPNNPKGRKPAKSPRPPKYTIKELAAILGVPSSTLGGALSRAGTAGPVAQTSGNADSKGYNPKNYYLKEEVIQWWQNQKHRE